MPSGTWLSKKQWIIAIIALGAIAFLAGGRQFMGSVGGAPDGFAMPVESVKIEPRPLTVALDSVGTLVANESVVLRPEVVGRITDIAFTEGQPVKKGEKLFQIDDRLARAELKQAAANLQLAQLEYERYNKLAGTGAATKRAADQARANLGVAQANHDLAKTRVDYTNISAPFDGVVGLRKVSPGDYVEVGQELANFVSYDPMKVNFTIPETEAGKLKPGQQIDITVEALPGETFSGTVFALDPQLDVGGRAVSLRASIPNPDNHLKSGFFARVALIVDQKPSALVVPENAIIPQGNDKFLYRIGAEDVAELIPVKIGTRLKGEVEILEGLNPGDEVITSGQMKLQPGAKVMRQPKSPPVDTAVSAEVKG